MTNQRVQRPSQPAVVPSNNSNRSTNEEANQLVRNMRQSLVNMPNTSAEPGRSASNPSPTNGMIPVHQWRPRGQQQVPLPLQISRTNSLPNAQSMPARNASHHRRVSAANYTGPSVTSPASNSNPSPQGRTLMPPPGQAGPMATPPNPNQYALHQGHLRSPTLVCLDQHGVNSVLSSPMCQYTSGFLLTPNPVAPLAQVHPFRITNENFARRAIDQVDEVTRACVRWLKPTSLTFRLRCIKGPAPPNMSSWLYREVTWPVDTLFKLNGQNLDARRKLHHGRDMPIDVTSNIVCGENRIESFTLATNIYTSPAEPPPQYFFAIEIVSLKSHADILEKVTARIKSAEEGLAAIQRAIIGNSEDVQCVTNTITITLTDPLTGSGICKLPVRAAECTHREAFDLHTYLSSRKQGSARESEPIGPDKWNCPLCGGHAGPDFLFVDGFLKQVGEELLQSGRADVRVIEVDKDGKWTAHEERRKEKEKAAAKEIEVIELSD